MGLTCQPVVSTVKKARKQRKFLTTTPIGRNSGANDMTNYAIMRFAKLKTMGSIGASLQHNFRERETHNADPERTPDNEHQGGQASSEIIGKLRQKLPDSFRKDAVLAVEYMMTASPEWWKKASPEDQAKFFERSREWLTEKYGKDNVLLTTIHRDETTPHMAAYVVPINDKGKLSAYSFTGQRQQLRDDQTGFAEKMKDLGLERGIEGSKAKHKSIQQFYKEIEQVDSPQLTPDDLQQRKKGLVGRETKAEALQRVNREISDQFTKAGLKTAQNRLNSAEIERLRKEIKTLAPQANQMRKLAKRFKIMNEQGITAPDGKSMGDYLREKTKESLVMETMEKTQRKKDRNKGKGIER